METQVNFESLTTDEQILITASSKLIKHFRGLESSGLLEEDKVASLIGCVKKIVGIAKSEVAIAEVERVDGQLKKKDR